MILGPQALGQRPAQVEPDVRLRLAIGADAAAITRLITRSVEGLAQEDYTFAQRSAAIGAVFLVDHGLIADGSYFVAETRDGRLVAAGGWSNRLALHGGHVLGDTGERIDPHSDPARIRAFFVDPDFARRGLATAILHACETDARRAGFTRATLGATLTGAPFYRRHGYAEDAREEASLPGGLSLTVIHMSRSLA